MDEVVKSILKYGLIPTFLLISLFLIIQDPSRGYKLKALILSPFFKIFNWFKRTYIANEVSANLDQFFNNKIYKNFLYRKKYNFKIKWVKSESDPILKSNNQLILRIRKEEDQTRNILNAARYAIPQIICTLIRDNIDKVSSLAIDYTFLHNLSEKLGNHGKAIFKKYFLSPEIENNPELPLRLQKLIAIDNYGIFVPIFINELENLGEGVYATTDFTDKTAEILNFLDYLLSISEREIGQEIELVHISNVIRVGTLLLAKTSLATRRGIWPYLRRINLNLEKGADSIYIIAFPRAGNFLDKLINVLEGNERINIENIYNPPNSILYKNSELKILSLRRNKLFTNEYFKKKIGFGNIEIGKEIMGKVIDLSTERAMVTFEDFEAIIERADCSWLYVDDCSMILSLGDERMYLIKSIDETRGLITLTLRFPIMDPWSKIVLPQIGNIVKVEILNYKTIGLVGLYENCSQVIIDANEMSWFGKHYYDLEDYIGKIIEMKVIGTDKDKRYIYGSLKQIDEDPWPKIHQALPEGKEFLARVVEVNDDLVTVKIDENYFAFINKDSLIKAGYEYANFKQNLVKGQGIEVIISKVFIARKKIRVELKRNL